MKKILAAVALLCVLTMCSCGKKTDIPESDTTPSVQNTLQTESFATQSESETENSTMQAQSTTQTAQTSQTSEYTQAALSDTTNPPAPTDINPTNSTATETEYITANEEKTTVQNDAVQSDSAQTTVRELKKTGEMEFSESKDNKYLASVAKKYNLNTENLVAIYTVPDNNGNLVLEFDGSCDSNGKPIRTADTLTAIYSIDKDFNSKRASETTELNEYSYGEMKVMFMSTTKYIMPKFEKELKG